jgi:signal peptidase I
MRTKRIIVVAILSFVQPGLGQFVNKQPGKAAAFLSTLWLLVLCARLTRTLHSPRGLLLWVAVGAGMMLWALVDAVRIASRFDESAKRPMNRAFVAVAILLVAANMWLGSLIRRPNNPMRINPYVIASDSMNPTFYVGDRVIVDAAAYSKSPPQRGDVIAFVRPGFGDTVFTKRVIGLPGDVVEGADAVKINGQLVHEGYLAPHDPAGTDTDPFGPIAVPSSEYFVMGDYRQESLDSREWGPIDSSQIRGKALYLYWSPNHSRIGKAVQ